MGKKKISNAKRDTVECGLFGLLHGKNTCTCYRNVMKATMQFMDFNQEDNNNLKTRELKPMQMASTVPKIKRLGLLRREN